MRSVPTMDGEAHWITLAVIVGGGMALLIVAALEAALSTVAPNHRR